MSLPEEHAVAEAFLLAVQSPANRLGVSVTAAARAATMRMRFVSMFHAFIFVCLVFNDFVVRIILGNRELLIRNQDRVDHVNDAV